MSPANPFQLACQVEAHSADVRAVLALPREASEGIVTAGRDNITHIWSEQTDPAGTSRLEQKATLVGHQNYVNSLTYLPPTLEYPKGLIASGSQDKTINIYNVDSPGEPIWTLIGHEGNVCALAPLSTQTSGVPFSLISGSWDKTARVWEGTRCIATLDGHSEAVWAVLGLEDGRFLTGSADKTILLWRGQSVVRTYTGHSDCVRDLLLLPGGKTFASASNDATIRTWSLEEGSPNQSISTLYGHTAYIYSLALVPTEDGGEIVSSGEDRSVRVWRGQECVQTLMQPCISLWSVDTTPSGDLVVGGSDGWLRLFTRSSTRVAPKEVVRAYEEQVASQDMSKDMVGDIRREDLPGVEVLQHPGKKDQHIQMVRTENGTVEAHQWDASGMEWKKVGDVVDAVDQGKSGRKQLYQGKEYDHVFDVDVGEGIPHLKLPYNRGENPFTVAQAFIDRHDLPPSYLDDVVRFIENNAGPVHLGEDASMTESADPFTGGSRYTPGGARKPKSSLQVLPQRMTLSFTQAQLKTIHKKILELATKGAPEAQVALSLTVPETKGIQKAVEALGTPQGDVKEEDIEILMSLADRWPRAQRFPVLDLLRLSLSRYRSVGSEDDARLEDWLRRLIQVGGVGQREAGVSEKPQEAGEMLALRGLANLLGSSRVAWTPVLLARTWEFINRSLDPHWDILTSQGQVALATSILNLCAIRDQALLQATADDALRTLPKTLLKAKDVEARYRLIIALGTLIYTFPKSSAIDASQITRVLAELHAKDSARLDPILADFKSLSP